MDTTFDLIEVSKAIESGMNAKDIVPFTHISSGSDRDVFRVDSNRVIKFSKRPSTKPNQNTREADFYSEIQNTKLESMFAEVFESVDGRYLLQEFIDTSPNPTEYEISEWKKYVESEGIVVHDLEPSNFGYRNGELVMVDYAGCYMD